DNITLNNFANHAYTHLLATSPITSILDTSSMMATASFRLTAQKDDNTTADNYDDTCVAQNTAVVLDYNLTQLSPTNSITLLNYVVTNGGVSETLSSNTIDFTTTRLNYTIDRLRYNNGSVTSNVEFNFNKNLLTPVSPFSFNILDINITDALGVGTSASLNDVARTYSGSRATFVYSRIRASDEYYEEISTLTAETPILTDIFCDMNFSICDSFGLDTANQEIDESDWFMNTRFSTTSFNEGNMDITNTTPSAADTPGGAFGLEDGNNTTVKITYTDARRAVVRVMITPDNWLLYNLADTWGRPTYDVEFIDVIDSNWSGEGDTGHVVDTNASISISKKRMNW
ncbi:MAG: hypothetical protein U9N49_05570, partial [Campylobacterota bacterium]|nr:hypothetical protein [Campylobacterota bacterium]